MQSEVAFAGAVVGAVQAAVERQDKGHGMFGDGVGGVRGYAHHTQAQAFGGGQIHMVVAGRAQGDQAGAASSQLLQHRSAEVVVDKRTDHFVVMGQCYGVQGQARGLEMQLVTVVLCGRDETVAVVGLAAEKNRAHGVFLSV